MYIEFVIFILAVSLILYTLLGGADFGAGIIELFIGDKSNSTVSKAIAPVWEANHMWLVIAVVILFNGFPKAYTVLSTHLHIPVLLFLVALIFRGAAFTFRHYDAYHDYSEHYYTNIFRYSSILSVFFLGVIISAFFGGTIPSSAESSFVEYYIAPWFNAFSISVGIFMIVLSAYIGSIFMLGEVKSEEGYDQLKRFVRRLFVAAVLSGIAIFAVSFLKNLVFHEMFLDHPMSIACIAIASLLVPFVFRLINDRSIWTLRVLTGAQIVLILLGWFFIQWPNFVVYGDGSTLSIYEASAPTITMKILFIALAVGVVIIFPGLYYLFKIFKTKKAN